MRKYIIRLQIILSLGAVSSFCLFLASFRPAEHELIEEQPPQPPAQPIHQPRAILTLNKIQQHDNTTEEQH